MPDETLKYKTYTELAAAFASGELPKDKYVLILDNDSCSLGYRGDDMDDDAAYEHCEPLFRGYGYDDLKDAVTALGIPCEGA